MKIIKTISVGLALLTLSSCATLFYNNATFEKAPIACIVDFFFAFTFIVPVVDLLNGSCKLNGGFLNGALRG